MSTRRMAWRFLLLLLCLMFVACAIDMGVRELLQSMESRS
jgi:hypothetical protein